MQRLLFISSLLATTLATSTALAAGGGSPTPTGPAQPTWSVFSTSAQPGASLGFQAQSTDSTSDRVAFIFCWGDGSSTRDPLTGFQLVDPVFSTVTSDQVTHTWSTAGTYSVTVNALDANGLSSPAAPPVSVTITEPKPQNDCGSGRNAGAGLALALPANCGVDPLGRSLGTAATLDWQAGNATDVYSFTTGQPGRLLTLRVSFSPFTAGGSPPIWLVDPSGGLRKPATSVECGGPGQACSTANAPTTYLVPATLDLAGQWHLVFGDATAFGGSSAFVSGSYSFHAHVGGGGDDCPSGRSPNLIVPSPADAPNDTTAFQLLLNGQVDCTGSLPYADLDMQDAYSFAVQAGEPTAISVLSSEGLPVCSSLRWQVSVPGLRLSPNATCPVDSLYTPAATGTVFLDLFPVWSAVTDTRGYHVRVATASRHSGDCFSGGDAGNTSGTALPMPVGACIGDIGAGDPDDWYVFDAPAGVWLSIASSSSQPQLLVPWEVYAPDGSLRLSRGGGATFLTDLAGAWRLRVTQSVPSLVQPAYSGGYGVSVTR